MHLLQLYVPHKNESALYSIMCNYCGVCFTPISRGLVYLGLALDIIVFTVNTRAQPAVMGRQTSVYHVYLVKTTQCNLTM